MSKLSIVLILLTFTLVYNEENTCLKTPNRFERKKHCLRCSEEDPMKCAECAKGFTLDDSGYCLGKFEKCKATDSNCLVCSKKDMTKCKFCKFNYVLKEGKCVPKQRMKLERHLTEGGEQTDCVERTTKTECETNCNWSEDPAFCCDIGKYAAVENEQLVCKECGSNCLTCTATECKKCKAEYEVDTATGACVKTVTPPTPQENSDKSSSSLLRFSSLLIILTFILF